MSGIRQNDFRENKAEIEVEKNIQKMRYLARRIGYCIAATIAGIKPATTMCLTNVKGKIFELWKEFGKGLFRNSHIGYYELRRSNGSAVVFFFSRHKLGEILKEEEIKHFLSCCGYNVNQSLECILNSLKEKFNSYSFPHEIGIFLGIPLKDVRAFIGLISLPCIQTNRWKIYGEPEGSLKIIEKYKQAEEKIRIILLKEDPVKIINKGRNNF